MNDYALEIRLVPAGLDGVWPELQHLESAHAYCWLMHGISSVHFDCCSHSDLCLPAGYGRGLSLPPAHLLSAPLHLAQQSTAPPESDPVWDQASCQLPAGRLRLCSPLFADPRLLTSRNECLIPRSAPGPPLLQLHRAWLKVCMNAAACETCECCTTPGCGECQ